MSTLTHTPATPVATDRPDYQVTGSRVLSAEWSKLWSLRSTWITLGVALLMAVVFGWIASASYSPTGHVRGPAEDAHNAVDLALGGLNFAQLGIGVLGVLITAGEYSTGMIRSTMAAVPRRLPVLWSKAAVYFVVVLIPATVAFFVSFLIGEGLVSGMKIALGLSDPGVLRTLFGAGLLMALSGVMGVALGSLLRSVAGGIGVFVVGVLLLGELVNLLPTSVSDAIGPYVPGNAGSAVVTLTHTSGILSPGAGLAVFAGWVVLALAGAAYRLVRRDV
jgi:ABC-type transport system involved in multi-copper enzyme maturation permease subunit